LGLGDWAQSPIPNPQIPNPQSPIPNNLYNNIIIYLNYTKINKLTKYILTNIFVDFEKVGLSIGK
jgi:hypothetical protein